MELFSHNIKKLQDGTFRVRKIKKNYSEKISCVSGNGTF